MENYDEIGNLLKRFGKVMEELRGQGVVTNQKDFTCQLGEWFVAILLGGRRAENAIQQCWDVQVGDKLIQVKTHAKAATNRNRFSTIRYCRSNELDELITVIFTHDYKLREVYRSKWAEVKKSVKKGKGNKARIPWKAQTKIDIDTLPRQDVLRLFR